MAGYGARACIRIPWPFDDVDIICKFECALCTYVYTYACSPINIANQFFRAPSHMHGQSSSREIPSPIASRPDLANGNLKLPRMLIQIKHHDACSYSYTNYKSTSGLASRSSRAYTRVRTYSNSNSKAVFNTIAS